LGDPLFEPGSGIVITFFTVLGSCGTQLNFLARPYQHLYSAGNLAQGGQFSLVWASKRQYPRGELPPGPANGPVISANDKPVSAAELL